MEANLLCEGIEVDVPDILAIYMNMIMVAFFYAPIIPLTIPFALGGGFFLTIFTKRNLFRRNKMP